MLSCSFLQMVDHAHTIKTIHHEAYRGSDKRPCHKCSFTEHQSYIRVFLGRNHPY